MGLGLRLGYEFVITTRVLRIEGYDSLLVRGILAERQAKARETNSSALRVLG